MSKHKNLEGQRFGRLLAVEEIEHIAPGIYNYRCKCDCGNEAVVTNVRLSQGITHSCGCLKKELLVKRNKENSIRKTDNQRILRIWRAMKHRCEFPNDTAYQYYGGKGIKVCEEWQDFNNFQKWCLTSGYSDVLTIDRKNPNKNYSPENCHWVDMTEQNNHKSNNKMLEYQGKIQSLAQWCKELGIDYARTKARINTCHWSVKDAFEKEKYSQITKLEN